jgi:acetyltransferase-like isoleucine patch superfamily enzyme
MIGLVYKRFLNKLAYIMPGGEKFRPWLQSKRGVKLGENVWISQYVYFDELYPEKITIGNNTTIGLRSSLISHIHWGKYDITKAKEIIIGNNVYIGPHCLILPNVHIGDNAVIMGGTVISRNVPPNTLIGTPVSEAIARITVPLTSETSYEKFIIGLRPLKTNKLKKEKETGK